MKKDVYVYEISGKAYINLTNKCSNNCDFCIRNHYDGIMDYYLWLNKEPSASQIIDCLGDVSKYKEVVFCGFGEPLYALDVMLEVAAFVKSRGVATRVNTNGQSILILGRDVAKQLAPVIDTINVSLNATDKFKYQQVCHSCYGEEAFDAMLQFAKSCVKYCKKTVLSIVDSVGEQEIEKARKIAQEVGADLRVREFI